MKNKVVFISGASRGIGQSLANYFAEKDYYVVGTSRNDFKFKNTSKNLIPIKLDITCRESIKNCFDFLKEKNLLPNILIILPSLDLIIFLMKIFVKLKTPVKFVEITSSHSSSFILKNN